MLGVLSNAFTEIVLERQENGGQDLLIKHWEEMIKLLPPGKERDELQVEWEEQMEWGKDSISQNKWDSLKELINSLKDRVSIRYTLMWSRSQVNI